MASSNRSDGDGSIYYDRSKQRWVGVAVVGWRDDKPVRRKVLATSRAKVASRLRELREKASAGQLTTGRVTVGQWMDAWLDIAARKNTDATMRGYRSKNAQYLVPLLGRHRLDRLRPEHVEQAWDELLGVGNPAKDDPEPLRPATVLQTHRILSRALKVAAQRGHVTQNVCTLIDAPSATAEEMTPLTRDQARRVLATARTAERNRARWSVALSLGLRQGEALGLTWDDIDPAAGTLTVRRALQRVVGSGLVLGGVKSRRSRRTVSLPASLLDELEDHRTAQERERLAAGTKWDGRGFVFARLDGRPIDPRRDWQDWTDLLAAAEVPHVRLHDARHTAATLLLLQGVDTRVVMEMLGHSQISVTTKYQHVVDEMQTAAAARMDSALWGE